MNAISEKATKFIPYTLYLLAFVIPLWRVLAPPVIMLLCLLVFLSGSYKRFTPWMKSRPPAMLLALLYLAYVCGMLLTSDTNAGFRDLETKLSLFVLPLAISLLLVHSTVSYRKILLWFSFGCFLSLMFGLIKASWVVWSYWNKAQGGWSATDFLNHTGFFFGVELSAFMHPGYFSVYLVLCISFLLHAVYYKQFSGSHSGFFIFLAVFFSLGVFLLAARIGFVGMAFCWLIFIPAVLIRKGLYKLSVVSLLVLMGLGLAVYFGSAVVKSRIDQMISGLLSPATDKSATESTSVRFLVWKASADLIADNWLTGVGTGDVKQELTRKYEELEMSGAFELKLNAHNQFLHTTLALGILGGLLLVYLLGFALLKFKKGPARYFIFITAFFMLFESFFEIQAGTVFFSFFYTLFATDHGSQG
jgi:O-antigen ligase